MSVVVPLNNCSLMSSLFPSKVFAISAEKSSHNSVVVISFLLSLYSALAGACEYSIGLR